MATDTCLTNNKFILLAFENFVIDKDKDGGLKQQKPVKTPENRALKPP